MCVFRVSESGTPAHQGSFRGQWTGCDSSVLLGGAMGGWGFVEVWWGRGVGVNVGGLVGLVRQVGRPGAGDSYGCMGGGCF